MSASDPNLPATLRAGLAAPASGTDLKLGPPFVDHAVLQRDRPISVWGTVRPSATVTVRFHRQSATTQAASDGRWLAWLKPEPASAEPADLTVVAEQTLVIRNVVVGDVWLASGQSNMEFSLAQVHEDERLAAAAVLPMIRQLKVDRQVAATPRLQAETSGWQTASPNTAAQFSAVAFFFARELHARLHVPIGILNASWGGTPIEAWMSDGARQATGLAPVLDARWEQAVRGCPPEIVSRYAADLAAWEAAEARSRERKELNLLAWPPPPPTPTSPERPGNLFNGMIAPLQPYTLRGVIWYQGEANTDRATEYAQLLPALIQGWRDDWQAAALPFYYVQLPPFSPKDGSSRPSWAELREAQAAALALPQTAMAVTIDLGDPADIHPARKQQVGRRLAQIALANEYGMAVDWTGPIFAAAEVEQDGIRVRFHYDTGGLCSFVEPVPSLELAGADRQFHPAVGRIDGECLLVSSPAVRRPIAVRYAWANAPIATLCNGAGLPVAPFRSDNW